MKKYRVVYNNGSYVYLDVEAKNEQEAIDIAEGTNGGDFTEIEGSYIWYPERVVDLDAPTCSIMR